MTIHRIPPHTVALGQALELVTEEAIHGDDGLVTTWDEVHGWHMLVPHDVEEREPGHARIFLVAGDMKQRGRMRPAGDTYAMWHDREPDRVASLEVPDALDVPLGRALRLDYRSDKWNDRGDAVDYTHDFAAGHMLPPLVYADDGEHPSTFVLVGGDFTVTPQGIM